MNKHRAFVAARWLVATASGVYAARQLFMVGQQEGNPAGGALHGLYGLAALLATVVLAAPEIVGWVISPVDWLIDSVLSPSESEPPPVDYTLARLYQQQRRFDESCEEYLKIIHYHPREWRAYLEGMATAGEGQRDDLAVKFHRLGLKTYRRNAKARERLGTALEGSRLIAANIAETAADTNEEPALETGEVPPDAKPPAGQ